MFAAGSVPEKHKELFYNTSMSFGPDGELLGIFRKARDTSIIIACVVQLVCNALLNFNKIAIDNNYLIMYIELQNGYIEQN